MLHEAERPRIIAETQDVELFASITLPWEIGNALSAKMKRRIMTATQAADALQVFRRMWIELIEVSVERSIQIAGDLRIYGYDAYMICCAQMMNCPLLTLDARRSHGRSGTTDADSSL